MEPKNTNEYAIIFSLYLGNKIKWIWFRLNDKKVRKMYRNILTILKGSAIICLQNERCDG